MTHDGTETRPAPQDGRAAETVSDDTATDRRPGEAVFAGLMTLGSLVLLWSAYGIAGFEELSSPGAVPMATSFVMLVTSGLVLVRTIKLPRRDGESLGHNILPPVVLIMAAFLVGYALLLRPLGFLPTSALFLIASVKLLGRRSWVFSIAVSLGSLVVIWIIFRIVFTVLMPSGIVPEAEFIQMLRNLASGGPS